MAKIYLVSEIRSDPHNGCFSIGIPKAFFNSKNALIEILSREGYERVDKNGDIPQLRERLKSEGVCRTTWKYIGCSNTSDLEVLTIEIED